MLSAAERQRGAKATTPSKLMKRYVRASDACMSARTNRTFSAREALRQKIKIKPLASVDRFRSAAERREEASPCAPRGGHFDRPVFGRRVPLTNCWCSHGSQSRSGRARRPFALAEKNIAQY